MRYVAAYLLAVLGGNENPTAADIEKILGSVGIDVDGEKLGKVISELKGKNISEVRIRVTDICMYLVSRSQTLVIEYRKARNFRG